MRVIHHRAHLAGYGGWTMPRFLRKAILGSQIHRAWFLGHGFGHFCQDGTAFGLATPCPVMPVATLPTPSSSLDLKDQLL